MSNWTQEYTVTYGGYSVGGTSGRKLIHYQRIDKDFTRLVFEIEFVIAKLVTDIDSAFTADCQAAEAAFRKPFQALTVTLGSTTEASYSHSGNTGLEIQPEILKNGEPHDSGRSRLYAIRITVGLPATTGAEDSSGLRDISVNVEYLPSRRRIITLAGTFTASGSTAARAQYEAAIGDVALAYKNSLNVDEWDLVGEPQTIQSYHDQTLEFTRTYKEIIYSQLGSADDARIIDQHLLIDVQTESPGDTPLAARLKTVQVAYDAWIDLNATQNLKSAYETVVRPWLETQGQTAAGGGAYAVVNDVPKYDFDDNRISGTVTLKVVNSSDVLEARLTVGTSDDKGKTFVHAWTGKPYSKYKYQGPGTLIKTITTRTVRVGLHVSLTPDQDMDSLIAEMGMQLQGLNESRSVEHITADPVMDYYYLGQGSAGAQTIQVTEINRVDRFYLYDPISSGGNRFETVNARR